MILKIFIAVSVSYHLGASDHNNTWTMTDVSICSEFACSGGIICRWNALSNRAEDLCGPATLRGELVTSHLCFFLFTSAPNSTNSFADSVFPSLIHWCSGVSPASFNAFMLKPFFNNLLISALSLLLTASWKSSCVCLMQSRDVEEEPFNFWLQERKSRGMRSRLLVTILFQNCLFFHSNLCFQKWVNFFLHYCSSGTKSNVASVMFIHFGCCECGVGTTLASNFICNEEFIKRRV